MDNENNNEITQKIKETEERREVVDVTRENKMSETYKVKSVSWADVGMEEDEEISDELDTTTQSRSGLVSGEENESEKTEADKEDDEKREQKKTEERNRMLLEYDELMEKLTKNNCKHIMSLLENEKENYADLRTSQIEESLLEPPKVKIDYHSEISHWGKWNREDIASSYIDKPSLISRIDSPYKVIERDNLKNLVQRSDYPEKFGVRASVDLKRLREFCKDKMIVTPGTQDDMINIYEELKKNSWPSIRMETLFRFADSLRTYEEDSAKENMFCKKAIKRSRKNKKEKIELNHDTTKAMWLLNLFEVANHKIKLAYSSLSSKKTYEAKDLWHENRRIHCKVFNDGSSFSDISMQNPESSEKPFSFRIFMSQTFTGIMIGPIVYVGMNTMIKYLFTMIENECVIMMLRDMNKDPQFESSVDENLFINFVIDLKKLKNPKRTEMAALYETLCLMMADTKCESSTLPLIDALIDAVDIDIHMTEELVRICGSVSGPLCIKMSGINKVNTLAEVDTAGGIEKYVRRTNRNHPVSKESVENLRWLFRMKVVTNYIKKYGMVPSLRGASGQLEQELNLMAAGGSYNNDIVTNQVNYKNVRMGQLLQPGQEVNIASRVIDKACTKDEYDFSGNSVKELIYYITNSDIPELIENMEINEGKKELDRSVIVTDRKDEENIGEIEKFKMVRLVEKEKELKTDARFYGVASFKLKIYISVLMEMIKRAMKLVPGQMMTMSEDERRHIMHQMSKLLDEDDSYSLFLDYSGHNTSQRPENNLFIMEEISDMYGFEEESKERKRMTMIVYLFSDIHILYEELLSDRIVVSRYQKGAIEGWFGPLWGIQSQLMMEDMMQSLNFSRYIGTTYSDDSCGVFVKKGLTKENLNDIIKFVKSYALRMGLLVKLSQTQITNGRCSMLKNHYFKDLPIDMSYKRILSISPNNEVLWGDDIERMMTIDSGFTSSTLRSDSAKRQVVIRNYRALTVVEKEVIRWSNFLAVDLEGGFITNKFAMRKYAEICIGKINDEETGAEELEGMLESGRCSLESELISSFFHFNMENRCLHQATLMLFYLPYSMYGFAMTSIPDCMISGFSHSNVKRISYVESLLDDTLSEKMYALCNMSKRAISYLSEPFPMEGGRFDTKTLLKDKLKKVLKSKVTNSNLSELLKLADENDEREFKHELLSTFQLCFSHRITSKFIECSVFKFIEDIYSKIDNSTTLSFFLGKREMNRLWNKAWKANHMIKYKVDEQKVTGSGFNFLIESRDRAKKSYLSADGTWREVSISFLDIEELPIIGKIKKDEIMGSISVIRKTGNVRSRSTKNRFRLSGPAQTHINTTKFDRDLEIEGMFSNKLIFMIYELVRYVKWIIMDCEKFGKISKESIDSLMKITDVTIKTFSDCGVDDVSDSVVCPRGGRYFHRAVSGGFNPRTGDLTSNIKSNKYEVTGMGNFIMNSGGVDNNINASLMITYVKVMMGYLGAMDEDVGPLKLSDDVLIHARDVTFNLERIRRKEEIGYVKQARRAPASLSTDRIKDKGRLYRNYSYFISCDSDVKGKFIDHKSVMPDEKISEISSFRSLYKYMEDQEIISPELITDETLEKLAPEIKMSINRDNYLDKFYSFYRGLNIIGNESYTKTVMRSIINAELLGEGRSSKGWVSDFNEYGYSMNYRSTLMKVFIISTCLVFKLEEVTPRKMKMIIRKDMTKANGVNNLSRMKKNSAHFHIRDKRISDLILMAFPTSGYRMIEMYEGIDELYDRLNNKIFETDMLVQYYETDIKHYVSMKKFDKEFGPIRYEEIGVDGGFFEDQKMVSAALKSYEMICAIHCKPQHLSSPTMSDVYPSALGLLTCLESEVRGKFVVDLFGGRGDFHFAMTELGIDHASISRNDGYNLINRVPGMKEIKSSIDVTRQDIYSDYMDKDIFLLDISHYTGNRGSLQRMIEDLYDNKKTIIVRLNSITSFDMIYLQKMCNSGDGKLLVPSVESPGYTYLLVRRKQGNGSHKLKEKVERGTGEESGLTEESETERERTKSGDEKRWKRKGKSFTESIIAEKLTNEIYKMRKESIFNSAPTEIMDHTQELISDEALISILLEKESDNKFIQERMEEKLRKGKKVEEMIVTELEENYFLRRDEKVEKMSLNDDDIKKIVTVRPRFLYSNKGCKNKKELTKQVIASYKRGDHLPVIDISQEMIIGSGKYIVGIKDCDKEVLKKIARHLMLQKFNGEDAYQSWKSIWLALDQCEGGIVELKGIFLSIETGSSFREKYHSFDRLVRIAKIVKKSYLGRNVDVTFLRLAGIKRGSMKSLVENKDRSHRYDCINFKLLLNRMMCLHKRLCLDLLAEPLNIAELVTDFTELKKTKRQKNRSYETMMLNANNRRSNRKEQLEVEKEIEEEIRALKSFSTLEEYLNDRMGNELFQNIVSSIGDANVTNIDKGTSFSLTSMIEEREEEVLEILGNEMMGLMGASREEVEKNKRMTVEEMRECISDDEWEDYE